MDKDSRVNKNKNIRKEKNNKKVIDNEEVQIIKEEKNHVVLSKLPYLILIISLLFIYSKYIGTKGLDIKTYNIINENIPKSFDGFKIVQFSDLKYGSTVDIKFLHNLVKQINKTKPDIVVFTGDLIYDNYKLSNDEIKKIEDELKKIDPLIGKYSIKGDNDNNNYYQTIINNSNFEDITNTYKLIYYKGLIPIVLYGLDSKITGKQDFIKTFEYPNNLEDTTYMATYKILLAHEPDTINEVTDYNISLMLSGHSLNNLINIPYIKNYYTVKGAKYYFNEVYDVKKTKLYISNGIGTNNLKLRLFNKPSISVIRLYSN